MSQAATPEEARATLLAFHAAEFRKQLAAGVPMAVGSDAGPFPHGTQAREFWPSVQYGMSAPMYCAQIRERRKAARLGWRHRQAEPGFYADIIGCAPAIRLKTSRCSSGGAS